MTDSFKVLACEGFRWAGMLRGRGTVLLGDRAHRLAPLDAVYVAPEAVHQFRAAGDEPFGFLCIVDRVRDRPVVIDS